jgi:hypothetical protein
VPIPRAVPFPVSPLTTVQSWLRGRVGNRTGFSSVSGIATVKTIS